MYQIYFCNTIGSKKLFLNIANSLTTPPLQYHLSLWQMTYNHKTKPASVKHSQSDNLKKKGGITRRLFKDTAANQTHEKCHSLSFGDTRGNDIYLRHTNEWDLLFRDYIYRWIRTVLICVLVSQKRAEAFHLATSHTRLSRERVVRHVNIEYKSSLCVYSGPGVGVKAGRLHKYESNYRALVDLALLASESWFI